MGEKRRGGSDDDDDSDDDDGRSGGGGGGDGGQVLALTVQTATRFTSGWIRISLLTHWNKSPRMGVHS
ncbi:hypothetical protein M0804_001083 [Polistes exclamans]|nr:hypothetical protein M0804_001083 [Polistes exclamans]